LLFTKLFEILRLFLIIPHYQTINSILALSRLDQGS
jgi:hypothetical protein